MGKDFLKERRKDWEEGGSREEKEEQGRGKKMGGTDQEGRKKTNHKHKRHRPKGMT